MMTLAFRAALEAVAKPTAQASEIIFVDLAELAELRRILNASAQLDQQTRH